MSVYKEKHINEMDVHPSMDGFMYKGIIWFDRCYKKEPYQLIAHFNVNTSKMEIINKGMLN